MLQVPLDLCFLSSEMTNSSETISEWPVAMALRLLQEADKNECSRWYEYINHLPREQDLVLPTQWPEILCSAIDNVVFEEQVQEVRRWRELVLQDTSLVTYVDTAVKERLDWALNVIQTRNCKVNIFESFYLKSRAKTVNILAPYFDLLNHSDEADTVFYVQDGYLCLDVNYAVTKGNEVFLNYGEHCPYTLLAKYGFWPDESVRNQLPIFLPRNLARSMLLPAAQTRLKLLQRVGIMATGTFVLYRGVDISDDLLVVLIVLTATDEEIDEIVTATEQSCSNDLKTTESWNIELDSSPYVLLGIIKSIGSYESVRNNAIVLLIDILISEVARETEALECSDSTSKEIYHESKRNDVRTTIENFKKYRIKFLSDTIAFIRQ